MKRQIVQINQKFINSSYFVHKYLILYNQFERTHTEDVVMTPLHIKFFIIIAPAATVGALLVLYGDFFICKEILVCYNEAKNMGVAHVFGATQTERSGIRGFRRAKHIVSRIPRFSKLGKES